MATSKRAQMWLVWLALAGSTACTATDVAPTNTAGMSAAGMSAAGMSAAGITGAVTGGASGMGAIDYCATMTPTTDTSALGALGTCLPTGIGLPCRTDSPETMCSAEASSDPAAQNGCRNAADCAVLDAIKAQVASMAGPSTSNIVRSCGLPYLGATDCGVVETGTEACVVTETAKVLAPGLSASCADCFTQTLLCNLRCLSHCSLDAESPACVACMHIEGCRGLFYQCSGLQPLE